MIPYMVGKLAPNSSHLTRGLFKYVLGRGYFRDVSLKTGTNMLHPFPPPQSLNLSDIDGQKSHVRQNSCVKTEVQLSLKPDTIHVIANPISNPICFILQ